MAARVAGLSTSQQSTVQGFEPLDDRQHTRHRILYGVTTVVVTAIIAIATIDGLGWWNPIGVDSARVTATGGGYELEVRYGTISRPALATPFDIIVTRPGGFAGPVTVAVEHDYLALWDENGLTPAPSAETVDGQWLLWEFDPPEGDTLKVIFDARIEPAAQDGRRGEVAVVEGSRHVVSVDFETRVMP
jgi:hypothetical protein